MADLARLRFDLAAFAEAVGQPLARWQADALALDHRTTVLVAPRQSGKSRSLAVAALWWAFRRPGQRVLVVSAGEDASRRLLAQAASVAVESPLLVASIVDETTGLLTLSNGDGAQHGTADGLLLIGDAICLLQAIERRFPDLGT
jgi:hypothetical protein